MKPQDQSKKQKRHEAIGWEGDLRSEGENSINMEMVKMVKRVFE